MWKSRDFVVAMIATSATLVAVAWAQSAKPSLLDSCSIPWDEMEAVPTPSGAKCVLFRRPTATLDQLALHVTTVNPGERPHDAHRHWEEELIIVKEGTLESMQNGTTTRLGPGSVIFDASNDLHGLKNVGDTPASYFVIKWFPPGSRTGEKP